jgi:hypothetical protein
MKSKQAVHWNSLGAAAVLGAILSIAWPTGLRGQAAKTQPQPNPHDLSAQQAVFSSHSKDFRALEEPLHGQEWEVVEFLDNVATTAEDRLDAANTMLRMYDCIVSETDRARVRPILKEQLAIYSWQMNHEAERTTGSLAFTKVPAAAQIGLQMKDDLRTAKQKLDAIAESLD